MDIAYGMVTCVNRSTVIGKKKPESLKQLFSTMLRFTQMPHKWTFHYTGINTSLTVIDTSLDIYLY